MGRRLHTEEPTWAGLRPRHCVPHHHHHHHHCGCNEEPGQRRTGEEHLSHSLPCMQSSPSPSLPLTVTVEAGVSLSLCRHDPGVNLLVLCGRLG
jgi:hypothetical protein